MKVLIAGAGSVGRHMAEQLALSGHDVRIVDVEPSVVGDKADGGPIDGVTWFLGDACEVGFLNKIGIETIDVVAAVTGDDEDNLVISLLSKQEFAVPRVVARVNNPKNEWMFNEMWGVDMSVSTPHLLTALVEEAVNVGSMVRLLSLEGGKTHLVEVTLAPDSPALKKEVGGLGLPREAAVVALVRAGHVIVPRNDTVVQGGDEVLVLVSLGSEAEATDAAIRAALVG
ncbi:MAG TPA: TrkA family potassium uptake protein [Ilumatobacteraceae bacterium]|nr:TrkA family potassium uptake protein [Ilumatobacteraceae bacterium]